MIAMAVRFFVTFLGFFFSLDFCEIRPDESSEGSVIDRFIIHNGYYGRKVIWGKARRKANFSKSARKRSRRRAIYTVGHHSMDPFVILILCGDVELNPGPTNQQRNNKPAKQAENQDFFEILIRLERKIDSGQENVLENQTRILTRLSIIEEEIEKFKGDIADLKTKQSDVESKVNAMSEDIGFTHEHGRD